MFNRLIKWLYFKQKNNLAYYDEQTKLLNRNWWEIQSKGKLIKRNFFLTMIDLNGLKKINDSQGHVAGDRLIESLSQALSAAFPGSLVIRYGGDEYLVLSESNPKYMLTEVQKDIDFSFGIAYHISGTEVLYTLKAADELMFDMKFKNR